MLCSPHAPLGIDGLLVGMGGGRIAGSLGSRLAGQEEKEEAIGGRVKDKSGVV